MNLQSLQLLRAFTSKHRPTIAEAGVRSLDLYSDPSRAKNYILMVFLRSRPESKRTETAFYATGADVVSFDFFPQEKREEMQQQLQFAHNQNVRSGHGMIGALFVMLMVVDTMATNVASVGFSRDALAPPGNWKEEMLIKMNEGVVI